MFPDEGVVLPLFVFFPRGYQACIGIEDESYLQVRASISSTSRRPLLSNWNLALKFGWPEAPILTQQAPNAPISTDQPTSVSVDHAAQQCAAVPISIHQSRKHSNQHQASGSGMQTTDTARSHGTDTAHSHSTVTAQSPRGPQLPPISTQTPRRGTAVTALVEASGERWVELMSKPLHPRGSSRRWPHPSFNLFFVFYFFKTKFILSRRQPPFNNRRGWRVLHVAEPPPKRRGQNAEGGAPPLGAPPLS